MRADLKPFRWTDTGSHRRAVQVVSTGQLWQAPARRFDHPTLGATLIGGDLYYRRKKDAQAAIDAAYPAQPERIDP